MNPWTLPAPFDAALWLILETAELTVVTVRRMSSNVDELGAAWVLAYWLAVLGLVHLGGWGSAQRHRVRVGNDAFEWDPTRRGGAWIGRAAALVRLQVAGETWVAASATVVGYGGALALIVVGLLWGWVLVLAAGWGVVRLLRARRQRRPWWT